MIEMSRRGFLKGAAGVALYVVVAPKAQAIWTPDAAIAVPELEIVQAHIWDGATVAGYFINPKKPPSTAFLHKDAADYFQIGSPVIVIAGELPFRTYFQRFIFRGSKDALIDGKERLVMAAWELSADDSGLESMYEYIDGAI